MQDGLLPLKQTVRHLLEPPLPLHVDVVGPIHHHFGDLGVLEQELDGSQPDDRIRNLVDDLRKHTPWQDVSLLAEDGERLLSHPQAPLGSRHLLQSTSVDPAKQPLVQAATNLHERIGAHQDRSASCSSCFSCSSRFAANRSTDRPALPRGGSRRPRSWAAGTLRSTGITATGERPKTRSTSSGEISRLVAPLTTNEQRSSRPVASMTRLAARNDSTSSPNTITTTSARPSPNLTVSSTPRGTCNTTTSAAERTASRTGPMSLAVTRSAGCTSAGPIGVLPQQVLEVARRELIADRNGVSDGPRRSIHGSPHRRADVGDTKIEVNEDAAPLPPCEARGKVGGQERRPSASPRSMDGDDPSQRLTLPGSRSKDAGDGAGQLATIGRPQEEAVRSRPQSSPKGLHRLGCVHGEEGTSVELCGGREPGRGHYSVGLQLPNGFGQLMLVRGGRHYPGPSGSVEEVHDFLGHVVLIEREDHPRDFFHIRSSTSWEDHRQRREARERPAGEARRNRPAREH